MKLQLFVCPSCGLAALINPHARSMGPEGNKIIGANCAVDRSNLSYVHDVDLDPTNTQFPSFSPHEASD